MNRNLNRLKYCTALFALAINANIFEIPYPGKVVEIYVKPGDIVKKGARLFKMESMKMENVFSIPEMGIIKDILIKQGVIYTSVCPAIVFDAITQKDIEQLIKTRRDEKTPPIIIKAKAKKNAVKRALKIAPTISKSSTHAIQAMSNAHIKRVVYEEEQNEKAENSTSFIYNEPDNKLNGWNESNSGALHNTAVPNVFMVWEAVKYNKTYNKMISSSCPSDGAANRRKLNERHIKIEIPAFFDNEKTLIMLALILLISAQLNIAPGWRFQQA